MRFGQATSANSKRHLSHDIGGGPPAMVLACSHRSTDICCGLPTSACLVHITHSLSGVEYLHHPWPTHNGQLTSGVACPHHLWPTMVSCASPLSCTQWLGDIRFGLPISPLACTKQLAGITRGFIISFVTDVPWFHYTFNAFSLSLVCV